MRLVLGDGGRAVLRARLSTKLRYCTAYVLTTRTVQKVEGKCSAIKLLVPVVLGTRAPNCWQLPTLSPARSALACPSWTMTAGAWTRAPTCEHPNLSVVRKTENARRPLRLRSSRSTILGPCIGPCASPCRACTTWNLTGIFGRYSEQMLLVVIHSFLPCSTVIALHACISTVNGKIRHPRVCQDTGPAGSTVHTAKGIPRSDRDAVTTSSGTPLSQQYSI